MEFRLPDGIFQVFKGYWTDAIGISRSAATLTCHNFYPHYEMKVIALPDGSPAWVCYAVQWAIYPERYQALKDWSRNSPEGRKATCSGKSSARTWTNRFSQMDKALEQKLAERWPTWFNTQGDPRHTGMTDGFRHGDGWFDILWQLSLLAVLDGSYRSRTPRKSAACDTNVSNFGVGAYLYGAGFAQYGANRIANAFAIVKSSNAGDPNKALYQNAGYQAAASGGQVAFNIRIRVFM